MSHRNNRREFLKTTALGGIGFWIAGSASADDAKEKSPNEQISFACIGIGGKGDSDTADAGKHGNVVAICDIDDNRLNKAGEKYTKAKKYNDFRKMFDEMGKQIDAVTVSTPDHTHAVASAMAMKLGKHCFTQKPMTHSLYEARRLAEIAREMKVATQMGNQGTSSGGLRKAAALVRAGVIGTVKEVHVWTNRPIWPQGGPRPEEKPIPETVHWDLWLGPAATRPYGNGYHPFAWRGFWDFGTGALGDMACHTMNMPFMALDLREPTAVEAESPGHNKDSYPKWSVIRYSFPERDKRPAVTMTWYDGGKKPPQDLINGEKMESSGSLLIGEKGKLYSPGDNGGSIKLIGEGVIEPKVEYPNSPGHFTEFARAIKEGKPAMSNFP
ncbi:MAG TPA: Gfo/Idh/MocA family oxidoreductase, partial [Isosphaeraceae bacterium]|nr:Gfo/Idh/MocA family oxidoreductase [Isosphaeraceae bacterium]